MRTMYEDGIDQGAAGRDHHRGSAARHRGRLSRVPLFRYKALSARGEMLDGQMEAGNDAEVVVAPAGTGSPAGRSAAAPSESVGGDSAWRALLEAQAVRRTASGAVHPATGDPARRRPAAGPRAGASCWSCPRRGRSAARSLEPCATRCAAARRCRRRSSASTALFSRLYVNMVRAGEAGGSLHETLRGWPTTSSAVARCAAG